ncbi:phosphatase PAP2 family protein [Glycomyces xiaoerkulensis]|uniref:phosphatase PAP2 family protein n=1 Tax=Glycomyces xiaoerkulensis TaxID=2038139 RepID=UPI0012FFE74D|nr:phosphatase PAP2 family protein [Glycomyces xiaoerkulensis]
MTVADDAVVEQLLRPMRRYIPVDWFDWEPYAERPRSLRPDLWLLAAFLVMSALLTFPSPLVELDYELRLWVIEHKVQWLWDAGRTVVLLGQAKYVAPLTLAFAVWCALRSRSIRPMLMYVLSFITLAVILGMKHLLGRPLSQHPFALGKVSPEGPMLFTYHPEGGGAITDATAYPSGHAVNSILLFGLIVMLIGGLLPRWLRLTLLIAPPVLVAVGQVYTGQHWLLDEPAGFMLGIVILRAAKRVDWHDLPLGPLRVFDPARRSTILILTILIVGVMITPTLPLVPALISAAVLPVLGLAWLLLTTRSARRREAAAVPRQASGSSRSA